MRSRIFASNVALSLFVLGCGSSSSSNPAPQDSGVAGDTSSADTTTPVDSTPSDSSPSEVDASTTYPAFMPPRPKLVNVATVISSPVFLPIFFSGDTEQSKLDGAISAFVASKEWSGLGEYGVESATKKDAVALSSAAPTTTTNDDIVTFLQGELDGTHAEVGPVDATTLGSEILVLFYPKTTTITAFGGTLCASIGAYHSSAKLASGAVAQYVVIPRCADASDATGDTSALDALSSMLGSAAADPLDGAGSPLGFNGFGKGFEAYTLGTGGEVGTACQFLDAITPPDLTFGITRQWSNAASLGYHDPCLPTPDAGAYFTSVPITKDTLTDPTLGSVTGAKLSPTATIDVELLSDAPTSGPWTVKAGSFAAPGLTFKLDTSTGTNGDVVHLTISGTTPSDAPVPFYVLSKLGTRSSVEFGLAGTK